MAGRAIEAAQTHHYVRAVAAFNCTGDKRDGVALKRPPARAIRALMNWKKHILTFVVIFLLMGLLLSGRGSCTQQQAGGPIRPPDATLATIDLADRPGHEAQRSYQIRCEVADTKEKKRRGLAGRPGLEPGAGSKTGTSGSAIVSSCPPNSRRRRARKSRRRPLPNLSRRWGPPLQASGVAGSGRRMPCAALGDSSSSHPACTGRAPRNDKRGEASGARPWSAAARRRRTSFQPS